MVKESGNDLEKSKMTWKKKLWSIGAVMASMLFFQIAEWILKENGLELRTAAQVVKGVYVWIIAPFLVLVCTYLLLAERGKGRVWKGLSILFAVLGVVLILGTGLFRGAYYLFQELVEETVVSDGVIEGKYSEGLSETQTRCYDVVWGIFRRDFSGHDVETITAVVQERYGADAELMEDSDLGISKASAFGVNPGVPGGNNEMPAVSASEKREFYICRAPANDFDGKYLYFVVGNNYQLTDNYLYRKMQQDAAQFWGGRRRISFCEEESGGYYGSHEERWSKIEYAEAEDPLMVWCYGRDDVASCAGDITNWIYYAIEDAHYGKPEKGKHLPIELRRIYIAAGKERFSFYIPEAAYWKDMDAWADNRDQIEVEIRTSASYAGISLDGDEEESGGSSETLNGDTAQNPNGELTGSSTADAAYEQRRNEAFIAQYDGSYEKECELSGGRIKYRILVLDAAAGSRFYGLIKSTDAGESWEVVSLDPFAGRSGMGIDFTFLDERLGFATLAHNGGDEGDLYVTEDGGKSYAPVTFQDVSVTLDNGFRYSPYDFPQMPYKEDGKLYVYCGQGTDGDYAGGDAAGMALYASADGGHTFTYVEIGLPDR